MASINEFVSRMQYGARPNLFKVYVNRFGFGDLEFFAKATQIPGRDMGVTPVNFKNNQVNLIGDTSTFPEWTVTVMNDENFTIRTMLEGWMEELKLTDRTGRASLGELGFDYGSMEVVAFDPNGNTIANYEFNKGFPSSLGPIEMGWESENSIQEYSVTFTYSYWLRIS